MPTICENDEQSKQTSDVQQTFKKRRGRVVVVCLFDEGESVVSKGVFSLAAPESLARRDGSWQSLLIRERLRER
jgi:hypothetical protein